jgi:hypothetical protein
MPRSPSWKVILKKLQTQPTVSVPEAGWVLGDLGRNAAYGAARAGTLGVPVLETGGKLRVPSIAVLHKLGLADDASPAIAAE